MPRGPRKAGGFPPELPSHSRTVRVGTDDKLCSRGSRQGKVAMIYGCSCKLITTNRGEKAGRLL